MAENCEFSLPPSHLTPSLGVNPFEFLDKFFIPKTRVLVLFVGEDFVILACVVFTQYQRVTDGRTDGQRSRSQLVQGLQLPLTPCKNKYIQFCVAASKRKRAISDVSNSVLVNDKYVTAAADANGVWSTGLRGRLIRIAPSGRQSYVPAILMDTVPSSTL